VAELEPDGTADAQEKQDVSTILLGAVGVVILALLAFGLFSPKPDRPQVGEPAPGFTLTLFDGSRISLRDLRGQIVMLNFWASWCSPCRQEAPALESVWQAHRDEGVVFVGITYKDSAGASQAFLEEYGITFLNGVDTKGKISDAYGVTAIPETYIIDRGGKVAWLHLGQVAADVLSEQLAQIP
jgi:cytochrome c biogenesis protein CcmG/thiol:disulfide interchange protein DsbE